MPMRTLVGAFVVTGALIATQVTTTAAASVKTSTSTSTPSVDSRHQQAKEFIERHDTNLNDKCHAAAHHILRNFRSFDTAAHGGRPDNRVSLSDLSAKDRRGRSALDIDALHITELATREHLTIEQAGRRLLPSLRREVQWDHIESGEAAQAFTRHPGWFYELDIAGHHDLPDSLVSREDLSAYIGYTDCLE